MIGCHPYITTDHPKVLPINFSNISQSLQEFNNSKVLTKYNIADFNAEAVYEKICNNIKNLF
jgi:hypothetical protein